MGHPAHHDLSKAEDVPQSRGLRNRAIGDVDKAHEIVKKTESTARWQQVRFMGKGRGFGRVPFCCLSAQEDVDLARMSPFLSLCAFALAVGSLTACRAHGQEATPPPASAPDPTAAPAEPSAPIVRRPPPGLGMMRNGVRPPVVMRMVDPSYSKEARAKKISGNVLVHLTVGTDGMPTDVRVKQGLGYGLDEKAVEAVRQYQFRPATKDGVPVATDLYISVNFQIF